MKILTLAARAQTQRPDRNLFRGAWRRCLAVIGWSAVACAAWAQPQLDVDTREAIVRVPAAVKDAFGKEVSGDVLVTTFRPTGAGPFPLVIINHGRDSDTRMQTPRPRYDSAARYFLRKGFAVAVPQRFGYGEVAAVGDPEDQMGCDAPRYRPAVEAAAHQVLAVARYMQAQPDIDPARLVIVGQSVGGFTTVAATSMRPPGLIASINFAGGHGGNPKTRAGEPCSAGRIEQAMGHFGSLAQAPMLWVYTENDLYFSPRNSRAWAEAFSKAGGKVDYRLLPPFGQDGHQLFTGAADRWQPVVEEFLGRHGFAVAGVIPRPVATGPGKAGDVAAVPLLPTKTRDEEYPKYVAAAAPKALAISPTGRMGWAFGDDVLSRALAFCQRRTGELCKLYAVDNDVVWAP